MNSNMDRARQFRSFAAGLALAVVALAGFAGPAAAGKQVPFRGCLDGVITRGPVNFPFVPVLVQGTGNATQLGQFTFAFPHVVNLATRIAIGTYEFTAANGDTLYGTSTGQATATARPGVLYIVEEVTITGGTGRFEDATGSFTVERLYDVATGTTTGCFEGSISSPGAASH